MNANRGGRAWGRGELLRLPAESGRGNGVDPAELETLGASEAIESLTGDFAEGNMPLGDDFAFPGPIAEAYFYDDADVIGIQGPVGSGKTTTKNRRKIRRARMVPRSVVDGVRYYKVLFIRETYRQLWATTIPSYLETFPKRLGEWSGGRGDPVRHHIRFEDEYGPIDFVAEFMAFGDDIIASMRGIQTTDIDLNEADTMPVEILTVGIGRIDRYPAREHFAGYDEASRSYGQIDCDFNAPDEDNWTFRVFHDEDERKRMSAALSQGLPEGAKPIRIAFYNQPGFGQPGCENLQNLSASYYPRQIAAMKLAGRGDMIERLVYNRITYLRAGDPVFQREFNPRLHVASSPLEPTPGLPLQIGLDQGFKGAAVIGQFLAPFHWRILAELHFPDERLLAAEFGRRLAELLQTRFPGQVVEAAWGDMAGEHGASQAADENATWNRIVSTSAGFRVRPQRLGTNRLQPRLEAVRAALEFVRGGETGLLIDPSCKFLRRGFAARYVWTDEVDASGDKRKVPDKRMTEANVLDALQYLLLSRVRPTGVNPISWPEALPRAALEGMPLPVPDPAAGLQTGWNILNPYGD